MDDNHENRLRDIALEIKLNSKTPLTTRQQNQNLKKYIFNKDSLIVDISRNFLNSNIFRDLIKLATKLKINKSIEDLFTNKYISTTESKKVSHIYLRNKQNLGAGQSRNNALKSCNGKYIAFCDCDDLWKPQKLEKQIKNFQLF